MTPRTLRAGLILLVTTLLLGGCQSLGDKKKYDALTLTLRAYENTLRWGDIEQAYGYLRPEQVTDVQIPPGLDNIRLTNYEVIAPKTPLGEHGISQTVLIHYIEQDRQMEKKLTDQQVWEYDPVAQRWHLISKVPEFGTAKMRVLPLNP